MADVRCRPIDRWDGPYTSERRRPPFGAGWVRTLSDLERELDYLGALDVVVGLDLRPHEIRLDGWPRASATPPPPVSLTMSARVGPLRFQCDRWTDWRANVRAIGLTLQRLRLVDEGGCTRSGEQYRGWSALPPARSAGPAVLTVDEAARILARYGGPWSDEGPTDAMVDALAQRVLDCDDTGAFLPGGAVAGLYRLAAKRHHPDRGGDAAVFRRLTEARDVLGEHGHA